MRVPFRKQRVDMKDVSIQPQVDSFWETLWADSGSSIGTYFSPRLLDRVWVANRCMQLVCQQIASMPLRFFGSSEPAWVANPDPVWFPNGIGDAVFAATWSMYGSGDAFLLITSRYASGLPSAWTVLDPLQVNVQAESGRRVYRYGQKPLNAEDVVQISRDPKGGLRGTSVLSAYAAQAWGLIGASDLGRAMVSTGGGVPNAILKSKHKLTGDQATALQAQWIAARARSSVGAPAVLPPEIDFQQLSFSPEDLMLLDVQGFSARVIASAFGVPSFMLNLPLEGGLTYQNPETLFETWWREELKPASDRIAHALSANMLPAGARVEFEARATLAPTFQNQVTSWLDLLKEGVVSIDEVRAAILHLPPSTEGEALDELSTPPSAGASPAQRPPATVAELRPAVVA
jgi:HK97 family phage portal protein